MPKEIDDDPVIFLSWEVEILIDLDLMNWLAVLLYSPCIWWYHAQYMFVYSYAKIGFWAVEVRETGVLLLVGNNCSLWFFHSLKPNFNCSLAWLVFRIIIQLSYNSEIYKSRHIVSVAIWSFIVVLHFAFDIFNDLWFLQVDHMGWNLAAQTAFSLILMGTDMELIWYVCSHDEDYIYWVLWSFNYLIRFLMFILVSLC